MSKKDEEAERLIEEQLSGEEFFWKKVEENGTPLIIPQQSGKCDVIFLYRSSEPSLDLSVESEDLYNHLLDPETGAPKKFYKKDNTDIYYLRVQDVPEDTCVKYAFKIGEVDQIDQYNKARNENGSYLQMPKSAPPKEIVRNNSKVDNFVSPDPNAIAQPNVSELELNHGLLTKDLKNEREIFIYTQ